MTKEQKLDLLVKIATIFNNTLLCASFITTAMIVPVGTACAAFVYLYIGLILAYVYRKHQHTALTLICWLPAMCFKRVTGWISR